MTDQEMEEYFYECGYIKVRKLPDGRWLGVLQMIYTGALCVNLNRLGHEAKYCYPRLKDAIEDMQVWDGVGDPPGRWIKYKGPDCERMNPIPI